MLVFVLNRSGLPLMPCTAGKARLLLKTGKAQVKQRTPFTIQLVYGSAGYKQEVNLGVDSGYQHIGISAVTPKEEILAAQVELRKDLVELNSERLSYRRTRRNRNLWYRRPRFSNRTGSKKARWFAPSIRNKIATHLNVIQKIGQLIPLTSIKVEVANFDIQKIKNPDIEGEDYQQGEQQGFGNVREYVLHRDGHRCQSCKGKSRDPILNVHHLESRKTGGNRPANLITLCQSCHHSYHSSPSPAMVKIPSAAKGFKAETFMTAVRWEIIKQLKLQYGTIVSSIYGYQTKALRIANHITKSHINDAFVIAAGTAQQRTTPYLIKQVRKCNRKLFKGSRSHLPNTAPRFINGYQRYDKVLFKGIECFIFGRRSSGYFDLRLLNGEKIHASAKSKSLKLKESFKTLLITRIKDFDATASIFAKGHPYSSRP